MLGIPVYILSFRSAFENMLEAAPFDLTFPQECIPPMGEPTMDKSGAIIIAIVVLMTIVFIIIIIIILTRSSSDFF